MVIKSEVLNDFLRFVGILIARFVVGSAVNLALKMIGDMIIKILDLKPMIDATMRDFCSKSLKRVHASDRVHDVVGTSRYHCGVLRSFPVERIKQGNE
ncbi:hypothetical protein Tco_0914003 [Tanacetum coccineum]